MCPFSHGFFTCDYTEIKNYGLYMKKVFQNCEIAKKAYLRFVRAADFTRNQRIFAKNH